MKNLLKIKNILSIVAFLAITISFTSCNDDDDDYTVPPVITNTEVGLSDSHITYAGADLHVEADVVAEGYISTIEIEIHMENPDDGWQYENTWTEFDGLLNTTFHEHIDIPEDAALGTYHFHFVVTDQQGNQTEFEVEDLEIQELVDETAPVLAVATAPTTDQAFTTGETITISGEATDNIGLGGMLIALVKADDNIADADVLGDNSNVIVMLHTHDFGDDSDEFEFSASINVGAANDNNMTPAAIEGDNAWESGDYYILARVKDEAGNWTFSAHYPIKITL